MPAAKEKTLSHGAVFLPAETRVWGSALENGNGIEARWPASSTLVWGWRQFYAGTGAGQLDQRYYTAIAGRFYTPDPVTRVNLANPITWNKYAYVNDDPVNFFDRHGTDWDDPNLEQGPDGGYGGGGGFGCAGTLGVWWDCPILPDPGDNGGNTSAPTPGSANFIPTVVWKTNPKAAVTAWDLAIAAVPKLAAQQQYALYPRYLYVNDECVSTDPLTASLELERNYVLEDQHGDPLGGSFQEYIAVVAGEHASGPTDLYNANDWDFITAANNTQYNFYQTFVATSLGFGPAPVMVKDNGAVFGSLAVQASKTQIIINGINMSGIRRCGPNDPKPRQ